MEIIKLDVIDQNKLLSSNVPASSYQEWDSTVTYNTGERVKVSYEADGTTLRQLVEEYESTVDANTGNYPPDNPDKWLPLGASNRFKMFDKYVYSQTENADSIEIILDANNTNKIGLLNLLATEVEFSHLIDVELITDGDGSSDSFVKETGWSYNTNGYWDCDGSQTEETRLYQQIGLIDVWYEVSFEITAITSGGIAGYVGGNNGDFANTVGVHTQIVKAGLANNYAGLIASPDFVGSVDNISVKKVPVYEKITTATLESSSWYSYFFSSYVFVTELFFSYPRYIANSKVRINIYNTQDTAKCGLCAVGSSVDFGKTQFDVRISLLDYSKKETDDWGQTYLKQGNYAREISLELWIENSQIDAIRRVFEDIRATACLFNCNNAGLSDFQSLVVYGFYREFTVTIPGPTMSKCSIDIQGLV